MSALASPRSRLTQCAVDGVLLAYRVKFVKGQEPWWPKLVLSASLANF